MAKAENSTEFAPAYELESLISDARRWADIVAHIVSDIGINNSPVPQISEDEASALLFAVYGLQDANKQADAYFHENWATFCSAHRAKVAA